MNEVNNLNIGVLVEAIVTKNGLTEVEAMRFVEQMFDVIRDGINDDYLVKVRGLGTFKIVSVDARESINVNTGERVTIAKHSKITFTPDSTMKEMVNRPFSQFDTVIVDLSEERREKSEESSPADEVKEEKEESLSTLTSSTPSAFNSQLSTEEADAIIVEDPVVDDFIYAEEVSEERREKREESSAADEPEPQPSVGAGRVPARESADDEPQPSVGAGRVPARESADDEPQPSVGAGDQNNVGAGRVPAREEPADDEPEPVAVEPEPIVEPEPEPTVGAGRVPAREEPAADDDVDDDDDDDENSTMWSRILWGIVIVLLIGGAAYGGYIYGRYEMEQELTADHWNAVADEQREATEETLSSLPVDSDSIVVDATKIGAMNTEVSEERREKSEESSADDAPSNNVGAGRVPARESADNAPSNNVGAGRVPAREESAEETFDSKKYEDMDARVRTGAYRIIGTDTEVTVKEGQTLKQISKAHLGEGMECYVEVYNGISASQPLQAGQKIKIPKLKWKKKR